MGLIRNMSIYAVVMVLMSVLVPIQLSSGFVSIRLDSPRNHLSPQISTLLSLDHNADIDRGLQRARELLQKTKAKLAAKESASISQVTPSIPFFASQQQAKKSIASRDGVVKFKDESTGLITADGEKMAQISEEEEWEIRPILDVFDNETKENQEALATASHQLASRDIAASVFNLRRQLQTSDYERIFDKRNIFIGEDN